MNKRLLIEILRQKLTQIENLTEVQLKDILEKLESQKAKLPLEDHSIIDWGISAIRVRMQQREQLMDLVREKIKSMGIALIQEWDNTTKPEKIYKSFTDKLLEIMSESADLEYAKGAGEVISDLLISLREHETLHKKSLNTILKNTSTFCSESADKLEKLSKNEDESEQNRKKASDLANLYKQAAKDIGSASKTRQG